MKELFEAKYVIGRELQGEDRTYSTSTIRALWLESDGKCPKCGCEYNYDFEDPSAKIENSNLQVAHIFGLRNFKYLSRSKKKFHIKDDTELNQYKNLMLLCKECHYSYDNPVTYLKYLDMLKIKKNVYIEKSSKEYVYSCLLASQDEVQELTKKLNSNKVASTGYDVTFFNKKIKFNLISDMKSTNMRRNFIDYTPVIEEYANKINPEFGILMLSLCRDIYVRLKQTNHDQNDVIDTMKQYLHINKIGMDSEIADAILAYAIWKCEVLEKYVTP